MGNIKIGIFVLIKSSLSSETRYSQQIENALNRDQTNLIDAINLFKYKNDFC
jgi:hypothetical protein